MAITLTDDKKGTIFRMLSSKTILDTGLAFGFDKHYKDTTAIKNAVYKIYRQVCAEPDKYNVSNEVVDIVNETIKSRSIVNKPPVKTLAEKKDEDLSLANDFKNILVGGRNKAFKVLNDKLERIGSSKKRLDDVNISSLAQVFGILFDKSQIIQGEATENVAVLAKVDKNMSAEDALEAVLKTREVYQVDKDRTTKKR